MSTYEHKLLASRFAALAPEPLISHAASTDIIRLAYTGGTTGKPKGVMLANRSVWMQAVLLMAARGMPPGARVLCPTPISHGAGAMIVPTLVMGGTFVLQRGFDPERFIDAVEQHRIESVFRQIKHQAMPVRSFKTKAALHEAVEAAFRDYARGPKSKRRRKPRPAA